MAMSIVRFKGKFWLGGGGEERRRMRRELIFCFLFTGVVMDLFLTPPWIVKGTECST